MSIGYIPRIALESSHNFSSLQKILFVWHNTYLNSWKKLMSINWHIWEHSYRPRDIQVPFFWSYLTPETQLSINVCSILQLIKRLMKGIINVPFISIFRAPVSKSVQLGTVPWSSWWCVYEANMEHKIRWRKTWYEVEKLWGQARAHNDNSCG